MNNSMNGALTNYHVFESDCEKRDVIIPNVEKERSILIVALVVTAGLRIVVAIVAFIGLIVIQNAKKFAQMQIVFDQNTTRKSTLQTKYLKGCRPEPLMSIYKKITFVYHLSACQI
jgi:hypothetical protein